MIACSSSSAQPFVCPTKWDLFRQLLALLPRGRAWQSHEDVAEFDGAPGSSQVGTFEVGATGLGQEVNVEQLTVLERFWAAYAEVLEYLHQRACALLDEFFCDTTQEMLPEWMVEYGYPDPCEPYLALCEKVRARGGATCAYIAEMAWRRGYKVWCADCSGAEAACAEAGLAETCICPPSAIHVLISAAESPAITAVEPFEAGSAVAGCTPPCPPVPDEIICLIERIRPAHVRATYEVIP